MSGWIPLFLGCGLGVAILAALAGPSNSKKKRDRSSGGDSGFDFPDLGGGHCDVGGDCGGGDGGGGD